MTATNAFEKNAKINNRDHIAKKRQEALEFSIREEHLPMWKPASSFWISTSRIHGMEVVAQNQGRFNNLKKEFLNYAHDPPQ